MLSLQHLIEEVVSISRLSQTSTEISDLPPFVLHSIYKAAVIVSHGVGGTVNMDCEQVLKSLKDTLHHASRRWGIGRMKICKSQHSWKILTSSGYYLQKLTDLNKPQGGVVEYVTVRQITITSANISVLSNTYIQVEYKSIPIQNY